MESCLKLPTKLFHVVWRCCARFDFRKACRRLVEVQRVRFDHRQTFISIAEDRRVPLDYGNASIRLVEVWKVRFDHQKRIGGLYMLGESVLTTAKLVRSM